MSENTNTSAQIPQTGSRHRGVAVEAVLGLTKDGKEQIGVLFEVIEGPCAGYRSTWYGYFSEKAFPICLRALRACGFEGDDMTRVELPNALPNDVMLVFREEADQEGRPRIRIAFVNSLTDGPAVKNTMDVAQKATFAANMRARILALSSADKPATAPAATSNKAPF